MDGFQQRLNMLRSYIKIAFRNIVKSKGYSTLNILGLAMGMAVALLIGLWVFNEYSYNKFLPESDRLYQVRRNYYGNGDTANFIGASLKLADALRKEIPDLSNVAETDFFGSHGLQAGDKKLYIKGGQTNLNFLNMFSFSMLRGNSATALKDPYSIVLTESTAKALFGKEDAMNEMVRFDNKHDLKVTGILKDIPSNSSFQFNYLVPFSYYEATDDMTSVARNRNFEWNGYQVFVQLKPGASFQTVSAKIRNIEKVDKDNIMSVKTDVLLQPMNHWHLYDKYENGHEAGGFIDYVRMFSIIGILVLLIACINFVNLTTARSEKRAKEVGVRKAIGSKRRDLVYQFLTESLLLSFIAFSVSIFMVILLLPAFNLLTNGHLVIPFDNGIFWLIVISAVFITGLASGSRPAFYLSSFNPVKVLKGTIQSGKMATLPRKIMVVIQFSCSIALIVGTVIIYMQIQYAKNRPKGYELNRLMMTEVSWDQRAGSGYEALKNEILQKGIVDRVTTASTYATWTGSHRTVDDWPGKKPDEIINMGRITVSDDYFSTLGMEFKEGRPFNNPADTLSVIVNEAGTKLMRLKNPMNQVINYLDSKLRIVGVVKDALTISPFAPADPTIFLYDPHPQAVIMYHVSNGFKTGDAIAALGPIFTKYNPAYPYLYEFADQSYAAKFNIELLIGKLAGLFATLAIFISCLGLFGLAAYIAELRTKEIGIRKVLGATVGQLWILLSKEFVVLVLISSIIATPFSYYFLQGWLQNYSYHIVVGAGVFIWSSFLALVITLITISFQSIKAALANPVTSLRSE
jgi:putative ABC transport system permease protein